MRAALLIFRKDVRRLWWELSFLAALIVGLAVLDASFEGRDRLGAMLGLLEFVIAFGSWYVIALAIQEDKLAGERAYWLTRPIQRSSLLVAKLLLVASFVMLPTLLAQMAALAARGASPWAYFPDLLAYDVPLAASLMVVAVVASVMANISGFVSALLLGVAIMAAGALGLDAVSRWLPFRSFGGPGTISRASYVVVCGVGLAAAAVLVFHYARRRTAATRILLVALAVFQGAALMAASNGRAILDRLVAASSSRLPNGEPTISYDPTREPPPPMAGPGLIDQLHIPIRIEGLPPGILVAAESIDYNVSAPGESDYHQAAELAGAAPVAISNGDAWLRLNLERSYVRQPQPQRFHAQLRLILVKVRTLQTPLSGRPARIIDDAWCSTPGQIPVSLTCYWPVQTPDYIQVLNPPPATRPGEIANYSTARGDTIYIVPGAPWGQRVWQETITRTPPGPATVEVRSTIARLEETLDIPDLSLWKYTGPGETRAFNGLSHEP